MLENSLTRILTGCIVLLVSISFTTVAWSTDCSGRTIKRERNLIIQRGLYEKAIEQCPAEAFLYYGYAFNLERLRKYPEALIRYETAVMLDPQMSKAFFSIGDILRLQKKMPAAIEAYKKGLAIDPDNSRVLKKLWELEH